MKFTEEELARFRRKKEKAKPRKERYRICIRTVLDGIIGTPNCNRKARVCLKFEMGGWWCVHVINYLD